MKTDILKNCSEELRKMPYSVPEDYFSQAKAEIRHRAATAEGNSQWRRFAPYASIAAAVAILLTAGTFFLGRGSSMDGMTYEDYLVYSDVLITAEYDQETQYAEASIADEDIIEYLIHTGVSAEMIEFSK